MQTEQLGAATFERWSPEEVKAARDAGEIVIIDVRTPQEFAFEHIEGAMNFPMAYFDPKALPGQSDKRIVLHCGSGIRSARMANVAAEAGLDVIAHLEGGFGAWKQAKLPFIGTEMSSGAPKRMEG
ncbi:putative adenylyltransferase/sulfurtransferase MoeZ [Roseivivax sp. THAF40]|uniref:rhodanese-like domain-containing protein n=1 Tax=unclassified Roseivivax TaxID=2639302 RepID=UPI0012697B94|nr:MULTISPECIES: rhodanese-like domain-containing protein [unclassified Roseivivax]QFS81271.1 putative adenylyltransferase/sulfurtransferase MoeZ [Roseivivax sp. THAF197b]QFT45000.1 putative adenylyltransferase/sulfurtransferase MoeZ [Roseivivax sp. THAF40]